MRVEVKAREIEEYRHLTGVKKTLFWRTNKDAIIWQGKSDEKKALKKRR